MAFGADNITFTINIKGEKTGQQWVGDFTVKTFLSHREDLIRGVKFRELLGPNPAAADSYSVNVADTFADLAVRVVKAPTFWVESNGGIDLIDSNVISEVHKQTMAVELEALKKLQAEGEKAKGELKKMTEAPSE